MYCIIYRCYKTSTEDCYIVFEDLGVNNFKNIDRRIGLQTDHYKLLLTKIAKWHACTAVMLSGVCTNKKLILIM